jgi:hypothetical protein
MYKFEISEQKPKELFDIYLEFEIQFGKVLYNSINDCSYLDLVEFVDGEKDWIPTIPDVKVLNSKIREEKIFEKHFDLLIKSLIQHIDDQLTNYVSGQLSKFFNNNNQSYQKYHPTERSKELSNKIIVYVFNMTGQETIDQDYKELGQHSKKIYAEKYEDFRQEIQYLAEAYSKFTTKIDLNKSTFNKSILLEYGFYELEKVNTLSVIGQTQLLEMILSNDLPYKIAMFDYLDFLPLLFKKSKTKENAYRLLSNWFNIDLRTVKGNCLVLNPGSSEDRSKYTADKSLHTVKKDFLKIG